ncbi:maleylpyruvate isomerase N-terminal domain-containing protein [Pseudonocardia nematodicida]|uniref:Maleylpyruvate isomerase N-terminal domain-containing protein n=1 Tax=Pseudonocardia nematodicida TaxID=1206997 RepID=A0ABV1KJB9_9PSEU
MVSDRVHAALPEWEGFARAVQARRPDSGTWCEGWTVRDILVHNTGNAAEFVRVLGAHLAGEPVATRAFEEREAVYRELDGPRLWSAFRARCEELVQLSATAVAELPAGAEIAWTGRIVHPDFFVEHMREEMVLHRWDMTGDDAVSLRSLGTPWMTAHSVREVGVPLLARGTASLGLGPEDRVEGRLRAPGTDDVLLTATASGATIELVPPAGEATVESDPATRALLLWGRRPGDPSRWHSRAAPEDLVRVRTLLSGY